MKKIVVFFSVLLIVGYAVLVLSGRLNKTAPNTPIVSSPTPTSESISFGNTIITVADREYAVGVIDVGDKNISLHSNLEDKLPSYQLQEDNSCVNLVNAGFYTTEDNPTGLLIIEGKTIKARNTSQLFDGVLSISKQGEKTISTSFAENSYFAVQSGPLLKTGGYFHSLSIRNDEYARRIVAATKAGNQLVFLVFYSPTSQYNGPLLEELPQAVSEFEKQASVDFVDAINLDGGSASAFIAENYSLTEISPIGSYFCIN